MHIKPFAVATLSLISGVARCRFKEVTQGSYVRDANMYSRVERFHVETHLSTLTDRERDVLEWLLDEGLSNKEIAETLQISLQAVKNHLRSIYEKIGIKSCRQLLPRADQIRSEYLCTKD